MGDLPQQSVWLLRQIQQLTPRGGEQTGGDEARDSEPLAPQRLVSLAIAMRAG